MIVLHLSECMKLYIKLTFELTEKETESFKEIIQKLSDITASSYTQTSATDYQLVTDSSKYAFSAILHQLIDTYRILFEKIISSPNKIFYVLKRTPRGLFGSGSYKVTT